MDVFAAFITNVTRELWKMKSIKNMDKIKCK